jgi:hypothetical protein
VGMYLCWACGKHVKRRTDAGEDHPLLLVILGLVGKLAKSMLA